MSAAVDRQLPCSVCIVCAYTWQQRIVSDVQSTMFLSFPRYNFGSDANDDTMKRAACASAGVFQHVPDGGNLKKAMASYVGRRERESARARARGVALVQYRLVCGSVYSCSRM